MDVSTPMTAILPAAPCEVSRWFADEVRPHEPALRAYLRGRFPSLTDPDDVVQETYIRLLRAHGSVRINSPKSFLFVTARNVAVDIFRRRNAGLIDQRADFDASSILMEDPASAEHFLREHRFQLLEEAIQSLPDRCRQVVMLKKVQGLSYEEISVRLGISHNTISAHLTAGVVKCRDYLMARGLVEDRNR